MPVPPDLALAESLLVDGQNRLWMGASDGKIFCRNGENGTWTGFGVANGLPKAMISQLAQSPDGTIWAGTLDEGLYYLCDGGFKALRAADGLASDAINSLFIDRDKIIWAGTRAGGLCRLTPRRLYNLRVLENGSERFPHSLAETPDGKLWVGTAGRGMLVWDGANFTQFLREPPISGHMFVRAVLAGRDGGLWWGAGPALYEWKTNTLVRQFDGNYDPWLQGDRVSALCEDLTGGIWVGTFNGQLRHWQGGEFISVGKPGSQPVTSLVMQRDGTLWAGTLGGGLIRMQTVKPTIFRADDGLGSDLVQTLFLDHDDVLWIGTAGGGLSRWQNGKLDSFGTAQGLTDDSILQIVEDDAKNLWLGGNGGILRVNKAELDKVASHQSAALHPQFLGWREGMLSEQCVVGFNAALKTASGNLYFSTSKGIVIVDPRKPITKASPPYVLLEKVMVDRHNVTGKFSRATQLPADEMIAADGLAVVPEIAPGPQAMQFQFTGLSFDAPDLIQFRYQLEGVDLGWVEAGRTRMATYAHLPPGEYTFHVIACNAQGTWNLTGAAARFVVLPFFWQRGWFTALIYAGGVVAVAAVILLAVRRRYRARLQRLEMERATQNERARIARDLHDEVGSSLTRISMLSEQVHSRLSDPEQLKIRARKLSDFAVHTTQAFEEIVWAVNPRNDSLRSLLEYLTHFTREHFEDSGITCRFLIPDELPDILLPPDTRHSLFLTVKEALNNVLKHSGATQVALRVELDAACLTITVQDDGRGFEYNTPTAGDTRHNGLPNMRQRIENLGGQFEIATGSGCGTGVCIRLARKKLALHKSGAKR